MKPNTLVPKLGLSPSKTKRQRRSNKLGSGNGNELELWKKFIEEEQNFLDDEEVILDFQSPYHHFINGEQQEKTEKVEKTEHVTFTFHIYQLFINFI